MIPCKRHFLTKFFKIFTDNRKERSSLIADGHIHSPFCPHGTTDSFEKYIEKAISLEFKEITFTEHAPLPKGFEDPTPTRDSAMNLGDLENYFGTITTLQKKYKTWIKINRGLEVDYIAGYEAEIKGFLSKYGSYIDDSILSVHFLKKGSQYYCLDYSPDGFNEMIDVFGATESIYKSYYGTLLKSIKADLGPSKPRRIGHITLVHKFQKKYPVQRGFEQEIRSVINEMANHGLQLDYNGAGTNKPLCQEPYPPDWVVQEVMKANIKIVYGSDAHQAIDLGQGLDRLNKSVTLASPTL
jgi:histidinol-phosphatase (PHP family)